MKTLPKRKSKKEYTHFLCLMILAMGMVDMDMEDMDTEDMDMGMAITTIHTTIIDIMAIITHTTTTEDMEDIIDYDM